MTWGTFRLIQQLVRPDEANVVGIGEQEREFARQVYTSEPQLWEEIQKSGRRTFAKMLSEAHS
ncbi:hypothetical protein HFO99_22305 [Rhizobium leguminosarum]|uniref:hypothetical protein n=1 Tax=Rhizobium leguminosarum TaxID=384 RepID=UPI001C96CCD5|nr:hypothetical protein [Rhizobium leguminosarum]MBY5336624.1 hypothetical protein [Rhizobium leguminosarum]